VFDVCQDGVRLAFVGDDFAMLPAGAACGGAGMKCDVAFGSCWLASAEGVALTVFATFGDA
jgi:hypothetical protein